MSWHARCGGQGETSDASKRDEASRFAETKEGTAPAGASKRPLEDLKSLLAGRSPAAALASIVLAAERGQLDVAALIAALDETAPQRPEKGPQTRPNATRRLSPRPTRVPPQLPSEHPRVVIVPSATGPRREGR